MNRILILSALALLPALSAVAGSPLQSVREHSARFDSKAKLSKCVELTPAKVMSRSDDAQHTFFEGFENRPEGFGTYYDEWLPEGWQDLSKSGQTVPEVGEPRHNLTWRVLSNENRSSAPVCYNYSYEGECFAYIMSDQAYGEHFELDEQDEWLIMPAVVPVTEDWLFFRLYFNAAWTVYNRDANDFTGVNNSLQVYASTDDGTTWTKVWDLIDDEIRKNWTEDELRSQLTSWEGQDYAPVYVRIADYVGQSVKFAFRFYGNYGHGVSLDNVTVGVPQPVASYAMPAGVLRQGVSPFCEFPADPKLIMPAGLEATWENRSEASLQYEWTYADASGAVVTSDAVDLVTPAYESGSVVKTPSLIGIFESRRSEPYCVNHPWLQAGGSIFGEDTSGNECEFGVGVYDVMDPLSHVGRSTDNVSFNPDIDLIWERNLGMMDGAVDVLGYCNLFPASPSAYGFDFIDMVVIVPEPLLEDSETVMCVYALKDGMPDQMLGMTAVKASDYQVSDQPTNIRFKFDVPVFVPANTDIITLMVHSDREHDTIVLPYMMTTSEAVGNSLIYMMAWDALSEDWYETFYNMNNMPFNSQAHFAGLLQSLGMTYADVEMLDADASIDAPMDGLVKEFKLRVTGTSADRIKVTEDGLTIPDWISYKVTEGTDGVHTLAITVKPIAFCEDRETRLHVVIPGDYASIDVKQQGNPEMPSGLTDVEAGSDVSVTVEAGDIVVDGAFGFAQVIDMAGRAVASASLSGHTVIAASHLPKGVYVVRVNGNGSFKIVK